MVSLGTSVFFLYSKNKEVTLVTILLSLDNLIISSRWFTGSIISAIFEDIILCNNELFTVLLIRICT